VIPELVQDVEVVVEKPAAYQAPGAPPPRDIGGAPVGAGAYAANHEIEALIRRLRATEDGRTVVATIEAIVAKGPHAVAAIPAIVDKMVHLPPFTLSILEIAKACGPSGATVAVQCLAAALPRFRRLLAQFAVVTDIILLADSGADLSDAIPYLRQFVEMADQLGESDFGLDTEDPLCPLPVRRGAEQRRLDQAQERARSDALTMARENGERIRQLIARHDGRDLAQAAPKEKLTVLLFDQTVSVLEREKAAYALCNIGDLQGLKCVLGADISSRAQEAAIQALGEMSDPHAVPPLINALKHRHAQLHEAAAEALGKTGDRRGVEPLIGRLNDMNASVRAAAAEALGKIGDGRAIEPLNAALSDKDEEVRHKTADAIERITGKRPKEGCFVATAAMGSYDHPAVLVLRQLRDEYLQKRKWGRGLIHIYYKCSPFLALLIQRHDFLKQITYFTVIAPMVAASKRLLQQYAESREPTVHPKDTPR
jgi:HEAT repeat protein